MTHTPIPPSHSLRIAVVCLILFLALTVIGARTCGAEEHHAALAVTVVTLASLGAVDAAQSIPCLHSATCREVNPLMRVPPAGFVTLKAVAVGGLVYAGWSVRKTHPRLAWALLGGMTVLQGAVVAHNARVRR